MCGSPLEPVICPEFLAIFGPNYLWGRGGARCQPPLSPIWAPLPTSSTHFGNALGETEVWDGVDYQPLRTDLAFAIGFRCVMVNRSNGVLRRYYDDTATNTITNNHNHNRSEVVEDSEDLQSQATLTVFCQHFANEHVFIKMSTLCGSPFDSRMWYSFNKWVLCVNMTQIPCIQLSMRAQLEYW